MEEQQEVALSPPCTNSTDHDPPAALEERLQDILQAWVLPALAVLGTLGQLLLLKEDKTDPKKTDHMR